jgi:hypothetical protein
VDRAHFGGFGADEERLVERALAAGRGQLAGVAIDLDEGDAARHLERLVRAPAIAAFMNSVQMGSAACAPLSPTGSLSS